MDISGGSDLAPSTKLSLTFLPLVESHAGGDSSLEYASDLDALSYVTFAAAMPGGWCMVADAPCDPNWIRIISPDGVVLTCGHGASTFADGEAQDAAFNEPHGIAPLPGGHACVVADRTNGRIRHVTRAGVVSTIAGTGDCGYPFNGPPPFDAGELAAASFRDPALVAVDVHGRVLVVDWMAHDDSGSTTRFRKIDQSSNQFTTLCDEEGVALHSIGCTSCAIDDRGSIWCVGTAGIVIIDNTGFSAGFHAWSFVQWSPTARSHTLCAIQAREAVVVVLSISARTYLGAVPHTGWLWALPHMPIELWHYILGFVSISELGSGGGSS